MINDNLTQDIEPGNSLAENEEGDSIPVGFNCRHNLIPLSKLFDDHDNVLMPPNRS
jgi:hypothetical protein